MDHYYFIVRNPVRSWISSIAELGLLIATIGLGKWIESPALEWCAGILTLLLLLVWANWIVTGKR